MFSARPRRVPVRAQAVSRRSESATEAQQQLLLPLLVAFLLATLLAWPSHAYSQGAPSSVTASTAGTHTVRAGETLWSLAARYYGNGQQWHALATLNGISESGTVIISVGQVLRVPTEAPPLAQARAAMAEAPPLETPNVALEPALEPERAVVAPVATPQSVEPEPAAMAAAPAQVEAPPAVAAYEPLAEPQRGTLMGGDPEERRSGTRVGLVRPADLAAARGGESTTIFLGPAPFDADTMAGTVYLTGTESFVEPAGRRMHDFETAPFLLSLDEWKAAGHVVGRAQGGSAVKSKVPERMQQRDLVQLALPEGFDATPGTYFVAVSHGAEVGSGTSLAIPTGLLVVEASPHDLPVARVMRLFGVVEQGQALLPFDDAPATPIVADVAPLETTVRWITEQPLLPTLQSYLILAPVEGAEMQPGDRFELVTGEDSKSRVAMVRVVRVGAEGATAIVMQQGQPTLRRGMTARRIGRAP